MRGNALLSGSSQDGATDEDLEKRRRRQVLETASLNQVRGTRSCETRDLGIGFSLKKA